MMAEKPKAFVVNDEVVWSKKNFAIESLLRQVKKWFQLRKNIEKQPKQQNGYYYNQKVL